MVQYCLLRDGEQSVEIALLRHESIESTVPNWADVIGVYAIKVGADAETPSDVTEMSPENAERLREVFLDMNEVSYRTESETETVIVTDEYGYVLVYKRSESKVLILFLIRTGSRLLSARQRCPYTSMC